MRDIDFTEELKKKVADQLFRFALLDYRKLSSVGDVMDQDRIYKAIHGVRLHRT